MNTISLNIIFLFFTTTVSANGVENLLNRAKDGLTKELKDLKITPSPSAPETTTIANEEDGEIKPLRFIDAHFVLSREAAATKVVDGKTLSSYDNSDVCEGSLSVPFYDYRKVKGEVGRHPRYWIAMADCTVPFRTTTNAERYPAYFIIKADAHITEGGEKYLNAGVQLMDSEKDVAEVFLSKEEASTVILDDENVSGVKVYTSLCTSEDYKKSGGDFIDVSVKFSDPH